MERPELRAKMTLLNAFFFKRQSDHAIGLEPLGIVRNGEQNSMSYVHRETLVYESQNAKGKKFKDSRVFE